MRKLFELLHDEISSGGDAVLVTVVASSGSTPRGAGARMLITKNGRVRGTIGGGAVEYQSELRAAQLLKEKRSQLQKYRLHPNDVADLGMICGGAVDVYFRYIPARDAGALALTEQIEKLFAAGEESWLICDVTEEGEGSMSVYSRRSGLTGAPVPEEVLSSLSGKPRQVAAEGRAFYCEELVRSGRVYIFGGGHVAQALVPALAAVGFRCVIVEDRPDFARPELFPGVEDTRVVEIPDYPAVAAEMTGDDYVCIMTRGHKDDYEAERAALRSKARYIGVIGSAAKSARVFDKLRADGFTDADFARVTTPIGLDISAETPAEIAVCIAAQLIMVRAGRPAGSWSIG